MAQWRARFKSCLHVFSKMLTLHSVEDIPVDRHTHISCEAKRLRSELAWVCLEDISHIVAFLKLPRACCNTELKQVLSSRDSLRRALFFLKTTPLRPVQSPMLGFVSFCILPEKQNSTVSKCFDSECYRAGKSTQETWLLEVAVLPQYCENISYKRQVKKFRSN